MNCCRGFLIDGLESDDLTPTMGFKAMLAVASEKRLICTAVLFTCGCQWVPGSDAELVSKAEARISRELADPSSAQFRDVHVASERSSRRIGMVCGEMNGKNRFGAYVGFKRFLYGRDSGLAQIEYDADTIGYDVEQSAALATNKSLFDHEWRDSC